MYCISDIPLYYNNVTCNNILLNIHTSDVAEFTEVKRMEEIEQGNTFTFNCTPSAANPPPSSRYVFERDGVDITEGVSGSILTVSSLNRSEDSGNYTCMVTNEAGSVTIATCLNVFCKCS